MRKADRNYTPGRTSAKRWRAENNAWADKLRRDREADKSVPAGVILREPMNSLIPPHVAQLEAEP